MTFQYTAEYHAFSVGDKVLARRKNGRIVSGVISRVWQGDPFPWPFFVRYESPLYPGEFVEDMFGPKDLVKA